MKSQKKIYYMDFFELENGRNLSRLKQLAHERLLTTRDWDRLFFWMDIHLALELLNNYESHCFVANLIEGYTSKEISLQLKISRQAVEKQITKAKRKIRNFLEEDYITL